jgi:hypothetical protein
MSPRSSRVTSTHINYGFWLIFDNTGVVRLTRTEPGVSRDERSMFIQATLPRSLWRTPTLRATIGVKADPAGSYTAEIEAAADALRGALGVDIDLKVIPPA